MRPDLLDLAERSRMMWRSSWTHRGVEGKAVVAVLASGVDGGVGAERAEEGG